jgi:hypothetical protein
MNPAIKPCVDYLLQVPGHKWDHYDAIGCYKDLHGAGYGAADQCAHPEFCKALGLSHEVIRGDGLHDLAYDPVSINLHKEDLPGHIKDRGDPIVPRRKCCFHMLWNIHLHSKMSTDYAKTFARRGYLANIPGYLDYSMKLESKDISHESQQCDQWSIAW